MSQFNDGTRESKIDGNEAQDVERDEALRLKTFTVDEVAEILRVTPARVYALARAEVLQPVRVLRQVRFARTAVEQFIARGGQPLPQRQHGPEG